MRSGDYRLNPLSFNHFAVSDFFSYAIKYCLEHLSGLILSIFLGSKKNFGHLNSS